MVFLLPEAVVLDYNEEFNAGTGVAGYILAVERRGPG